MKNRKLSLLALALAVVLAVSTAACGDGGNGEQATSAIPPAATAPTETAAPSLASGPSPIETAASATSDNGAQDAPAFPEVEKLEQPLAEAPGDVPPELGVIWEAWQLLNKDYVDKSKLDPEGFTEEAIRGMLKVLEDPQTSYVSPEVLAGSFGDVFKGKFEGIGAQVSMNRSGKLVVVSPIAGSPAEAAGIRSGDIILAADGESLEGLSILEAVSKIRGPEGTTVLLLVRHLGDIDPIEIAVKRGVIPLTSVHLRSEPGAKFTHVRVTGFYPNTADQLKELIVEAGKQGAEGLILDIRGNPGGTLNAAVDVASQFLDDGLVLYVVDGDGKRTDWKVRGGGVATNVPMVVLINKGSASSSEVLAGALQDYERATIIGDSSFGKGSVNHLRQLSNGGGLYITIAHWYTPLGRVIEDGGITPDIEVTDRDAQEADIKQLKRAIQELETMTGVKETKGVGS